MESLIADRDCETVISRRVCVPDEGVFQSPMISRVTYIRCTCSMRDKKGGQKASRTIQIEILFQFHIVSNLPRFRGCKCDSCSD